MYLDSAKAVLNRKAILIHTTSSLWNSTIHYFNPIGNESYIFAATIDKIEFELNLLEFYVLCPVSLQGEVMGLDIFCF